MQVIAPYENRHKCEIGSCENGLRGKYEKMCLRDKNVNIWVFGAKMWKLVFWERVWGAKCKNTCRSCENESLGQSVRISHVNMDVWGKLWEWVMWKRVLGAKCENRSCENESLGQMWEWVIWIWVFGAKCENGSCENGSYGQNVRIGHVKMPLGGSVRIGIVKMSLWGKMWEWVM